MTQVIESPVFGAAPQPGLAFPANGGGIPLTVVPPATFPALLAEDPGRLFPTFVPEPEKLIWEYVHDATSRRAIFPEQLDGGITLPATFSRPPDVSYSPGQDSPQIPVVRGWPAYPGEVPAIGVATGPETEDTSEGGLTGGFIGDAYLLDEARNILASATYHAEPLYSQTIVELIHENRDERDRIHNDLRRILFPLRRLLPGRSGLIWKVQVDAEKQEVDESEAPRVIYASIFTVHVWFEMWTATDVTTAANVIERITVGTTPYTDASPLGAGDLFLTIRLPG